METTARIKSMEEVGEDAWERFIGRHPLSAVYHHAAWHRVVEKTYGYKSKYCVIGNGEIEAALPFVPVRGLSMKTRLVSYPFSDACDPLVSGKEDMAAIIGTVEDFRAAQGITSAELRTYRLAEAVPGATPGGPAKYCNFVLDLGGNAKDLFRSFHKDCVQRAIRKAQNSSVEVVEGATLDDMKEFYRLHTATRKRLGVPVQPFRFFKNLWEILYPLKIASLLLARADGVNIAGVVQLKFKESVYYKFAASDRGSIAKKPNHLIIWKMVEDAIREGYRYLDFGRTYVGDSGLMQWKARWGAARKDLTYVYPAGCGENSFHREDSRTNGVLSNILRNMPCFVVRASGEVFYRFLA